MGDTTAHLLPQRTAALTARRKGGSTPLPPTQLEKREPLVIRLDIIAVRHEERNGECQHSRNVPHYVASRSRNTPTSRRHPRRNNEVARNKASTNWVPRKTPQGHTERSQATYDSQKTISDNRESLESGEVVPNRGTEAIIEETEAKRTRRLKGKAIVTDSPTSNAKETHPSLMARRSKNLTITEQPLDAPPLLTRREQKYDPPIMEQGDKFMELGAGLDQDLGVQLTELELAEVDNLVLETERLEMEDNMIDIENDDLLGDSPDFDAEKIEAISQLSPANAAITKMATLSQHLPIDKVAAAHEEPGSKNQTGPYIPKGLLKKKTPRSPDIKGENASKKLHTLKGKASPKKKNAPVRLYHEAFNCQVQFTSTMDQLFSVCMMSKILHRSSPLRGSFPWVRLGSGPLHPGRLYLGWIEPSTALVSRRGRVVSAWGEIEPGWWLPPQARPATWTTSSGQN
ncbi:hypothetical protein YC2023_010381 [Brassica napus]